MAKKRAKPRNYVPWKPNTREFPTLDQDMRREAARLGLPLGFWIRTIVTAHLYRHGTPATRVGQTT